MIKEQTMYCFNDKQLNFIENEFCFYSVLNKKLELSDILNNEVFIFFKDSNYKYSKSILQEKNHISIIITATKLFKDTDKTINFFSYEFIFNDFNKAYDFFLKEDKVMQDKYTLNFLGIYPKNHQTTLKYKENKELIYSY